MSDLDKDLKILKVELQNVIENVQRVPSIRIEAAMLLIVRKLEELDERIKTMPPSSHV